MQMRHLRVVHAFLMAAASATRLVSNLSSSIVYQMNERTEPRQCASQATLASRTRRSSCTSAAVAMPPNERNFAHSRESTEALCAR